MRRSMIAAVEFRAKQAKWSMLTDKLYANHFLFGIDFDWLEHSKDGKFLVFKVIFKCQ